MGCGKCGSCGGGGKHLCPFSFGLALGITCFLSVIVWMLWVTYYGPTPMMMAHDMVVPTFSTVLVRALWALVKGFIFGFVLALIYDLFACCFKSKYGKCGSGMGCGCGCNCCSKKGCNCNGSCGCSCTCCKK